MASTEDPKIVRTPQAQDLDRAPRSVEDQERSGQDGTVLTIEERLALLREEHTGDILPDIARSRGARPDMHYFWASTTNQTDPIYKRLRLGYEFVRADELPDLESEFGVKDGQFEGCISVNEMILMRIDKRLANELMKINHHEKPLAEEQRIQTNAVQPVEDRMGKKLGGLDAEDQGFSNVVDDRRAPKSFV